VNIDFEQDSDLKFVKIRPDEIDYVTVLYRERELFRPHRYAKHKMRPIVTDVPWSLSVYWS